MSTVRTAYQECGHSYNTLLAENASYDAAGTRSVPEKVSSRKKVLRLFKGKKSQNENVNYTSSTAPKYNSRPIAQPQSQPKSVQPSPVKDVPQPAQRTAQFEVITTPTYIDPGVELPAFYKDVSKIKAVLSSVDQEKAKLVVLHDSAKKMAKTPELQAAQQQIAELVKCIKRHLSHANERITALQKKNEEDYTAAVNSIDVHGADDEIDSKSKRLSSVFRMRTTVTVGVVAKFQKVCDDFKDFEHRVSQEYHDDVKRRIQLVTQQEVNDDYVEEIIDSGEADQVFRKALMQNRGQAVIDLNRVIEERHEGMQKLYKDLLQLMQMMEDFSMLVYEQGKMIDSIAHQVGVTGDLIRRATDELIQAKKHKKTTNKLQVTAGLAGAGAATAGVGLVALKAAGMLAPLAL